MPSRCRSCVFWELDQVSADRACDGGGSALEKEAWFSDTLLEWGTCGHLAYVDGVPVGYVTFAPPAYVPRSQAFPTSPPSADAVLLMTAYLEPEVVGSGLGRMLVQAVAREAARRGIKAIEAFGREGVPDPSDTCLLPADYLRAVGFKTVRPHPSTPRLRLDMKTTLSWREDVEYAIDRLLGSMSPALSPR
ncbi:MAG TPA: GNAT family N-acetyltransferase [Jatrophihabitantaceae bacterium]|nr:GNAT family N-acetyltransferase [Jatrophihabitantaceae bacterium]